jgi:TPR repeat protein
MGADGCPLDLVAAHKWFNIAAMGGNLRAMECRAEIAEDMTAREIIEAQRQARAMMGFGSRMAA